MSTEPWFQTRCPEQSWRVRHLGTALAVFLWSATTTGSAGLESETDVRSSHPVRIQSEQLVADMNSDTAEFSGAVRVEGDGYAMTADFLTIQFRPGSVGRNRLDGKVSTQDISRMTAHGRVQIQTDTLTATAEQAGYEPGSGRFWLLATDPPPGAEVSQTAGHSTPAAQRPSAARVRVTLLPAAAR